MNLPKSQKGAIKTGKLPKKVPPNNTGSSQREVGDRFEIDVMNSEKADPTCIFAQRTEGSRGAADIMSVRVNPTTGKTFTRLIQCKRSGFMAPHEREKAMALINALSRDPDSAGYYIAWRVAGKVWRMERVTSLAELTRKR